MEAPAERSAEPKPPSAPRERGPRTAPARDAARESRETLVVALGATAPAEAAFQRGDLPGEAPVEAAFSADALVRLYPGRFSQIHIVGPAGATWDVLATRLMPGARNVTDRVGTVGNALAKRTGVRVACHVVPDAADDVAGALATLARIGLPDGRLSVDITHADAPLSVALFSLLLHATTLRDRLDIGSVFSGVAGTANDGRRTTDQATAPAESSEEVIAMGETAPMDDSSTASGQGTTDEATSGNDAAAAPEGDGMTTDAAEMGSGTSIPDTSSDETEPSENAEAGSAETETERPDVEAMETDASDSTADVSQEPSGRPVVRMLDLGAAADLVRWSDAADRFRATADATAATRLFAPDSDLERAAARYDLAAQGSASATLRADASALADALAAHPKGDIGFDLVRDALADGPREIAGHDDDTGALFALAMRHLRARRVAAAVLVAWEAVVGRIAEAMGTGAGQRERAVSVALRLLPEARLLHRFHKDIVGGRMESVAGRNDARRLGGMLGGAISSLRNALAAPDLGERIAALPAPERPPRPEWGDRREPRGEGRSGESRPWPRRDDGAPRPDGGAPRADSDRPRGPRSDSPRPDGPRPDGPRFDGPRPDRSRTDAPGAGSSDAPRGPRPDGGDRPRGPRPDGGGDRPRGPRFDGPRPDGPRGDRPQRRDDGERGPRPDGPRFDGPRPDRGERRDRPDRGDRPDRSDAPPRPAPPRGDTIADALPEEVRKRLLGG